MMSGEVGAVAVPEGLRRWECEGSRERGEDCGCCGRHCDGEVSEGGHIGVDGLRVVEIGRGANV